MARLLEQLIARDPAREALVDDVGSTTWAELNRRVDRLVHALRERGLEPGSRVALLSGNRREFYEVLLACLHGAWTLVPVNWHLAPEEVAYVLDDAGAGAVVADGRFARLAADAVAMASARPRARALVVVGPAGDGFEAYEEVLAAAAAGEPADQAAGSVMYYTSGTTGHPKGVRYTAAEVGGSIDELAASVVRLPIALGVPSEGTTLVCGPAYHSAQLAFSQFPLLHGSRLVATHGFDAASVLNLLARHQVTNVHLVPTQFVRLLGLPDEQRAAFDPSALVQVFHGAAPCPPDVKRRMIEWWGPRITEYYGATETGFMSMASSQEWLARPGTVGRPTPTMEVAVVTDDGKVLGPGEEGQLWFRSRVGADFAYHNAPQKTEGAHLDGMMSVGDIGWADEEGYLYLSDRKIDMIISGGVNIYPAEIEGVLASHPSVQDVAVFGVPNDEFGEEVKAVVQPSAAAPAGPELAEALTAYAREHLAGFKVPRSVDFVDALPRTETGKLQKRILREPYWAGSGRRI